MHLHHLTPVSAPKAVAVVAPPPGVDFIFRRVVASHNHRRREGECLCSGHLSACPRQSAFLVGAVTGVRGGA